MTPFDTVIVVDWSARATPSPAKPAADAIWIAVARADGTDTTYHRTRAAASAALSDLLAGERAAGRRVLAGFDFPFGYPAGFAKAITGRPSALALWDHLAAEITDRDDNANNRFEVAAALNRQFPGTGPFWGHPSKGGIADLPDKGSARTQHGLPERRTVEAAVPRTQPCWKLFTTGSVGSQALLGLPRLAALRAQFGPDLAVWPFEAPDRAIVLAEIYPSLLDDVVQKQLTDDRIKDEVQVRVLADALHALQDQSDFADAFTAASGPALAEEGWILGVGIEEALIAAAHPRAPRLRNDCFALPPGVEWTPVETALDRLAQSLSPVTPTETVPVAEALGRILAKEAVAKRANPPAANAAVDGYGFAAETLGPPPHQLPLTEGRAAAGAPFDGTVAPGTALRILTGAILPDGIDTIVLEEDTRRVGDAILFDGPIKPGANCRKAGEDVTEGAPALPAARCLTPPDLALLSALGIADIPVHRRLRVGVLSTGDELIVPGKRQAPPAQTYDANRPMLLSLAARWGYEAVEFGIVPDNRARLKDTLDRAAQEVDVLLTSGGASAGGPV